MNNYWKRKIKYEFWPYWLFYAPFVPIWIYYALKAGSLTYFTNCNPFIKNGGFIQSSKYTILKQIATQYLPETTFIEKDKISDFINNSLPKTYPLILKPDFGERGKDVSLVENKEQLIYLLNENPQDYIIQEYIDYPIELGIFYYHYPLTETYGITGITGKNFLVFKGDGKTNIEQFITKNIRAYSRKEYLLSKYSTQLDKILTKDEELLLEPIGNHSRGTTFIDQSILIQPQLVEILHSISQNIEGFHYGRYDLKTKSIEALYNGKFKIFEVNGANSEATHIYDPTTYSFFSAYSEVLKHLKIQYEIAKENHEKGFPFQSSFQFLKELIKHFK